MHNKKLDVLFDLSFIHETEEMSRLDDFYIQVSDDFMEGASVRIVMDANGFRLTPWRDRFGKGFTENPTPSEIAQMLRNVVTQRKVFNALGKDNAKTLAFLTAVSEHVKEPITPLLGLQQPKSRRQGTISKELATVTNLFGNREPKPDQPAGTARDTSVKSIPQPSA
jgi:hypothetical protein